MTTTFDPTAHLLRTLDATTDTLDSDLVELIGRATAAREALANGQRIWSGVSTLLGQRAGEVEAGVARADALLTALNALGVADDVILAAYRVAR